MPSRATHTLTLYALALIALLLLWLVAGTGRWAWKRLPRRWQRPLLSAGGYAVLSLFALVFVGPFGWMLATSLKVDLEIFSSQVKWLPTVPTIRVQMVDSNGATKEAYVPVKEMAEAGKTQQVAVLEEQEDGQSLIRPIPENQTQRAAFFADRRQDRTVGTPLLKEVHALSPQWHNYPDALSSFPFVQYTLNTLVLCVTTMIGTVFSAALPAYGFSRLRWKGRDGLFFLLIATMMLPPQVTMLPVFLLFRTLHWTGTQLPLIVPSFFGSAFYIFLMRQFFLTIPQELSDAARMDGCSELGILVRILAPIAQPAFATVALLSFTAAWMDFTGPLIYLHDERTYTLAVGLLSFLGRHSNEWSLLMAAATVMTLPMLLLFFFAQRTYIQGIAVTGLKG